MRLDFATLAFGYRVLAGGNTPNWATSLGQGQGHRINNDPAIDEMLKGMVYSSVPLEKITTKIGKGGNVVAGNTPDSPIVIAAVFSKVYINTTLINDAKFVLLITRDTSKSHAGRLRLKYGPSNTYEENGRLYSNATFFREVTRQLSLAEDACWFVSEINVVNQDELVLKSVIVNPEGKSEYKDNATLHAAWKELEPSISELTPNSDAKECGKNVLLYGVPGCGKSHTIKRDYCNDDDYIERVVFHPDYTYSDFIGQILPKITDGDVTYEFEMGPFTRILKNAIEDSAHNYYLVIEEINRGNAPAIFGDIFQLLDREDNGVSEYGITNENMAKAIYGIEDAQITIPSNLFILATMNTADQNVFTLDTAFKRRWNMESIRNDIVGCEHANTPVCDTAVTWVQFATEINDFIIEDSEGNLSSEDNRLGAWFVKEGDLHNAKGFAEKVLMYLWNDAFKFSRDKVFKSEYKTLDDVIDGFIAHRFCVFTDTFSFANKDVIAPVDNGAAEENKLTVDAYLEGKNEQVIVLYNALYDAVNTEITELNAYTVGSLNYIGFTAPGISKRNFCDVMFQKDRLVLLAEVPSDDTLLSVGEQLAYDGHKNHYFKFFINNATDIENAVKIIVDSYYQLSTDTDTTELSVDEFLAGKNPAMVNLYSQFETALSQRIDGLDIGTTKQYIRIRKNGTIIAEVHVNRNKVKVNTKEPTRADLLIGTKKPESFGWAKDYEIVLTAENIETVCEAIINSNRL